MKFCENAIAQLTIFLLLQRGWHSLDKEATSQLSTSVLLFEVGEVFLHGLPYYFRESYRFWMICFWLEVHVTIYLLDSHS